MKDAFTPGPWFTQSARVLAGSENPLDDGEPISIADCDMDMRVDHDTTACANARLIAAAPELHAMLSVCRDALASLDEGDLGYGEPGDGSRYPIRDEMLASIDAALARVNGSPQEREAEVSGPERSDG